MKFCYLVTKLWLNLLIFSTRATDASLTKLYVHQRITVVYIQIPLISCLFMASDGRDGRTIEADFFLCVCV